MTTNDDAHLHFNGTSLSNAGLAMGNVTVDFERPFTNPPGWGLPVYGGGALSMYSQLAVVSPWKFSYENETLIITLELAGVENNDLNVELKGQSIIVKSTTYDKKQKNYDYRIQDDYDISTLDASYRLCVLVIKIQKLKSPRKIDVKMVSDYQSSPEDVKKLLEQIEIPAALPPLPPGWDRQQIYDPPVYGPTRYKTEFHELKNPR